MVLTKLHFFITYCILTHCAPPISPDLSNAQYKIAIEGDDSIEN